MGKTALPTAAFLAVTLATMLALATPAYPQVVSEDLAADEDGNLVGPRPPDYEVDENGLLIIGGDVRIPCSAIGVSQDPELREAGPIPEAQAKKIERASREEIRTCRTAGFDTAVDLPASASASGSVLASSGASTTTSSATATGSASPSSSAANVGAALPETGGPALSALLLSAGGLLALRARR